MRALKTITDALSKAALVLAATILIYSVAHILLETVLRSVFATSTYVLDEFIGFAILSITFLSLAWTLRTGSMIRVMLITDVLPGWARRAAEFVVSATACVLVTSGCVFFFHNFLKDWQRGAVSESIAEVPLWIPGLVVVVGASLLALQLFVRSLAVLLGEMDAESEAGEVL